MSNQRKHIFGLLLLLLFVAYYSNNTMFYHSHWVNNYLITHSHWHNEKNTETPVRSHSHLPEQYTLIQIIESTIWNNDFVIPETIRPFLYLGLLESVFILKNPSVDHPQYAQLRAPPICNFSYN